MGLSDAALAAWLKGVCYCGQWLTDGHIPAGAIKALARPKARSELEAAGLWIANGDGGIVVHDYLQWNPSREQFEAMKSKRSEAGKKGAKATWG
jgi:hypothetical protein